MTPKNKKVYVVLRAEILKHFHDTNNAGAFNEDGYPINEAIKIAKSQLEADLKFGELRLTFEDMLLNSVEQCQIILKSNLAARFKKVVAFNDLLTL